MTTTFLAYELSYEYRGGPALPEARNSSLIYSAPSASEAVAAAQRWMEGRLIAVPEFFARFTYFQIHPYIIGPIDDKGGLFNSRQFRLMEWSRDRAGVDMATYCEWKIAEYQKSEAKDNGQKSG